ncbi:hypothetical protein YIM730264_20460 [Thermus hydrothermalis]
MHVLCVKARSYISSRVALVNRPVPLEDTPTTLGVQYLTVRQYSVKTRVPM